jgi:uncharacterized protein (TIGR03067 family)
MIRVLILTIATGLVVSVSSLCADDKTPASQQPAPDVKGTWLPTDGVAAGQKLPDNVLSTTKLIMTPETYTVIVGEQKEDGELKIDFAKKPATVDVRPTMGPNKGKMIPAIIEVTGDTMKVCYNTAGPDRPKDFTSTAENKFVLMTYKRQK